ncbi:hypothetical protein [Streptomyces phaeochromogenes]|uniref:hypothetical protein n=1 Tax=Streptomyces phaeochromogenes TaxID=1923 RepID=UPI0033C34DEE
MVYAEDRVHDYDHHYDGHHQYDHHCDGHHDYDSDGPESGIAVESGATGLRLALFITGAVQQLRHPEHPRLPRP